MSTVPPLEFRTADVPETTREPAVNPYDSVIKALAEDRDPETGRSRKARSFDLPRKSDEDEKNLERIIQQFQQGGKAYGVTVRKRVSTADGVATVTVWAVDRITRNAKDGEDEAEPVKTVAKNK